MTVVLRWRGVTTMVGLLLLVGCAAPRQAGPAPETLWPSVKSSPVKKQTTEQVLPPAESAVTYELLADADARLQQHDWPAVINIAEQGLRIDRREARWYLLLAESYHGMNQPAQSKLFASQGLRYCQGGVCSQLQRLADDN